MDNDMSRTHTDQREPAQTDPKPANADAATLIGDMGRRARTAARVLALAETDEKNAALRHAAQTVRADRDGIIAANARDLEAAGARGLSEAMTDRLRLTPDRLEAIASALEDVARLGDPVGETIADWQRPNGLSIARVRTPLGVIGVSDESRPNVTADAAALCLKAGNAVILRGGSEAFHSNQAIFRAIQAGLAQAGLPGDAVQLVPTTDRAAVGAMLAASGLIDVIVPRGGRSLVARVEAESRVPVFAHLEGLCHMYVDGMADAGMARDLVLNAKMRRTGICGALETLLIDRRARHMAGGILAALQEAGCEIRGDEGVQALADGIVPAGEDDWSSEYLAPVLSVRFVEGLDGALAHIARYSSGHTESIVTEDPATAEAFLTRVDSAIVMHNASTQFADGGEFGMGAEIGIATGRIHARGPVGVEQLTSFKYQVRGRGQTRP